MAEKAGSNSQMPMRTLGQTGVEVSLVGLGGWHLGFKSMDEDLSIRIIRTAIDNGINTATSCAAFAISDVRAAIRQSTIAASITFLVQLNLKTLVAWQFCATPRSAVWTIGRCWWKHVFDVGDSTTN